MKGGARVCRECSEVECCRCLTQTSVEVKKMNEWSEEAFDALAEEDGEGGGRFLT